jgi:curli biogenesis system outer membrane secretion channel CsgG
MNRSVRFLSITFSISVVLVLLGAWHTGARASCQDRPTKDSPGATPAPSNSPPEESAGQETIKKRVAVLDFDASAVGTDVLGDKVDVGKEIARLLAQQLAKQKIYLVVDSKTMSADLAEHNFSKSDRYDHEFAVKLGKRLGADAVIMGSVTLFGKDPHARPVPQDEVIRRKIKAKVAAETRIIDVATGEIVAVANGRGESKREGISLTSGGSNWHDFKSGNFGFDSNEFQETILGEAVNDMVQQLATNLAADASQLSSASSKPQ